MKKTKKFKAAVLIAIVLITASLVYIVIAANPGEEDNPLITLSYLNSVFKPDIEQSIKNNVKNEVDSKIDISVNEQIRNIIDEEISNRIESTGEITLQTYHAVEVPAGKTILGYAGTEIILRSGSALSIAGKDQNGNLILDQGLSNTTTGKDILPGENIEKNLLHIVPRKDGRGVNVTSYSYFMIRGKYDIIDTK